MEKELIGYLIEPSDFETLRTLNRRLFGDGSHFTADQRRDIANLMHVILLRVEPVAVEDLK